MQNKKYDNKIASYALEKSIDFILPPVCPATGEFVEQNGMVSATFWQSLSFINAPFCHKCGAPFSHDDNNDATMQCGLCLENEPVYRMGRSALVYNDASRDLILKFKHGDQTHAVKAFFPWLKQAGGALLDQTDTVIPVPLHPFRLVKRRYNQADLMARELIKSYPDITYCADGLKRIRHTQSQGHKKKAERIKNIRQAFAVNPAHLPAVEGKNILVIDDVYTTGATLNECAAILYRHGAAAVDILTLARVIRD